MLAAGNGLKSALRTPGKTLLFLLILTVTAALLTISCCVYGAVRGYLNDCDDYFHTIAELEYIGRDYPDQTVYDEAFAAAVEENRDILSGLIASDAVLAWEPASAELAYSPLIHRKDMLVPDPDTAVLRVYLDSYNDQIGVYNAIVTETLYSRLDFTNKLIMFRTLDGDASLACSDTYLVIGRFYAGRLQNPCFQQTAVTVEEDGTNTKLPAELPAGASPEEEAPFLRYAENLRAANDGLPVSYTADIEDNYLFHQQVLTLLQGRFFTREEYDTGAKVCIISEKTAGMLGLEPGDKLPFSVYHAAGDLYAAHGHTLTDEGDYEIVGITSHSDSYPYRIFLPDAKAAGSAFYPVNGYTLGQFRLKNDGVPALLEAAAPLLEQGFRLNVYDQGYAAATAPMEELLFISGIFLAVCLLLAACALAMQSHIFISRQRETGRTMFAMGSGRLHVCVYFLSAALALTVCGAAFGAVIGRQAEGWVFQILQRFAAQFAEQDLRFSTTRLAITRTLDFDPASSLGAYLCAAGILVGGTLIFTLLFALFSLRERKNAKKRKKEPRPRKRAGRVSRLSGSFKYGLLSLRRGRGRTVAVLLLGLATALFFGRLSSSLIGYQEQLDAYKAKAVISGSATDCYGKRISGLTLDGGLVAQLCSAELLENCCVTADLGHIRILGGDDGGPIDYDFSEYGSYLYESLFYWLSKEPAWTGTNSVANTPQFHFSESGSVEWLDGWSEADFIRLETEEYTYYDGYLDMSSTRQYQTGPSVCALPKDLMEERGIRLGDQINALAAYYHPEWGEILCLVQLRVVAAYVAPVGSTTVFSPLTLVRPELEDRNLFRQFNAEEDRDIWVGRKSWTAESLAKYQAMGLTPAMSYSSLTFTLTDAAKLDETRSLLAELGFTWVHSEERTKPYAMIEDEIYLNTTQSMERQIQYVSVLYGALYLLAGVIGFALAWLLLLSRRREIAVMRALGTQSGRILGNFLLEQLLLMAVGLALGIGVCRLTGTALNPTQLLLTAAFLTVWILSTLICLAAGLHKRSFAALTEPE